jgi:hypothetical protein
VPLAVPMPEIECVTGSAIASATRPLKDGKPLPPPTAHNPIVRDGMLAG